MDSSLNPFSVAYPATTAAASRIRSAVGSTIAVPPNRKNPMMMMAIPPPSSSSSSFVIKQSFGAKFDDKNSWGLRAFNTKNSNETILGSGESDSDDDDVTAFAEDDPYEYRIYTLDENYKKKGNNKKKDVVPPTSWIDIIIKLMKNEEAPKQSGLIEEGTYECWYYPNGVVRYEYCVAFVKPNDNEGYECMNYANGNTKWEKWVWKGGRSPFPFPKKSKEEKKDGWVDKAKDLSFTSWVNSLAGEVYKRVTDSIK